MTIETKYNIGDEVWLSYGGRSVKTNIQVIYFQARDGGTATYYQMNYKGVVVQYKEDNIYSTKEELLKSL